VVPVTDVAAPLRAVGSGVLGPVYCVDASMSVDVGGATVRSEIDVADAAAALASVVLGSATMTKSV